LVELVLHRLSQRGIVPIFSSYPVQTAPEQAAPNDSIVSRGDPAAGSSSASSEVALGLGSRKFDLRGRTVLLAMDGSGAAAAGARVALALAKTHGAVVHVISVIDTRTVLFPPAFDVALAIKDPDRDLTTHQEQVQELRASLSKIIGHVIDWPIRVVIGTPSSSIVDQAKRVDAALIIVGLRRHGRVDRALNNETSLNVMRNSTCPVLGVVPELTGLPVRILAATDFSAISLVASRTARAIAGDGAALVLAYVPPLTALLGDEGERRIHDLGVRAVFETAAKELSDDGATFDHIVLERDISKSTAATLLEYAASSHADIIAAGTGHRGYVERWMMGSVSTELVRDGAHSVLIVPAAHSDRRA
jgi:nucleotide-binding universal stress UspA family protein